MTTTLIKTPPTLKAFKDWIIAYIGDLERETGYDYWFLQDTFMDGFKEFDHEPTDEEFTEYVNYFTGVTLEHDW